MRKAILSSNISKVTQTKKKIYHRMTRLLMFFIVKTRLDIIFSILITVNFAKNLSYTDIKAIKTILCYIKRLIDYSILYSDNRENFSIEG